MSVRRTVSTHTASMSRDGGVGRDIPGDRRGIRYGFRCVCESVNEVSVGGAIRGIHT